MTSLNLENSEMSNKFFIKRIHEDARIPTRANFLDAGYDISSCENTVVPAMTRKLISTGLIFYFGDSENSKDGVLRTYARIAPRSGLALNRGIDVFAGVIDAGYRGEVKVLLYNSSKNDFIVNKGDKIAQFIIEVILTPEIREINDEIQGFGIPEEIEQGRGQGRSSRGFGSSGV